MEANRTTVATDPPVQRCKCCGGIIDCDEAAARHTPTPWVADIRLGALAIYPASDKVTCFSEISQTAILYQGGRGEPSRTGGYLYVSAEQVANAEFIVRAVNSHAALVEALEEAIDAAGHSDYCVKVNLELSDALSELPSEDRTDGDSAWRCACRRAKWESALAAAKVKP